MKQKAVVLLSGGMDSATALYWTAERYEIVKVLTFDYGQRGVKYELGAAMALADSVCLLDKHQVIKAEIPTVTSSLVNQNKPLDPSTKMDDGLPASFVPGRNLIFISLAIPAIYEHNANMLVGGWNSQDFSGYPDCRPLFLYHAQQALVHALGWEDIDVPCGSQGPLWIMSPVQYDNKVVVVKKGTRMGVPWELTRSCYSTHKRPCLECDSCLLRVKAFMQAGVRDPLVGERRWKDVLLGRKDK